MTACSDRHPWLADCRGPLWITLLAAAGLSGLSMWTYGFDFGINNNEFHSVIVYRIAHIASFSKDSLAMTLGSYTSPFWIVVGFASRFFDPRIVFAVFYFLSRYLMVLGMGSLAISFTNNARTRSFALAMLVTLSAGFLRRLPLGGDPAMDTYLSQTFFSYGLCLLALSAFYEGRWRVSAILTGVAYNVNEVQANFILGIVCALVAFQLLRRRSEARRAIQCLAILVVIASPTIAWTYRVITKAGSGEFLWGKALVDFVKFYYPSHYFLLGKSVLEASSGISLLVVPLVLAASSGIRKRETVVITSVALLAYAMADAAMDFSGPTRVYFQLHLLRSDVFALAIAIAVACSMVINLFFEKNWIWTSYCIALVALLLGKYRGALLVALFAVTFEFVEKGFAGSNVLGRLRGIAGRSYAAAAVVGILLLSAALSNHAEVLALASAPVLVLIKDLRKTRLVGSILLVVCAGVILSLDAVNKRDELLERRNGRAEMERLCIEARAALPDSALVSVPPSWTVRALLRRSVYVSIEEGAAYLWDKGFEVGYLRRLGNIGIPYTPGVRVRGSEADSAYHDRFSESIMKLRDEGVTHAIVNRATVGRMGTSCLVGTDHFCLIAL